MIYQFTQEKLKELITNVYQLGVQDFYDEMIYFDINHITYRDCMNRTKEMLFNNKFKFKEDGGLL